jgi:hypothetical protein
MDETVMSRNGYRSGFAGLAAAMLCLSVSAPVCLARDDAEIIIFEQRGCEWCDVWNEQIAPVFPKTPEAKCARLRRVDIHDPNADILQRIKPVIYTPTFVVMENGEEIGRVRGYAGEDFFWFHLGQQLKKLTPPCPLPN